MNDSLKAQHMENIGHDRARDLYELLCAACEKRPDGMSDAEQHIIGDIATMEQLKLDLYADVAKRGAVEEFKNGRQRLMRENKSIQQARMLMEQQRKHMNELRLTPASRKVAPQSLDDGAFDNF
ncbi:P27 family phage terminase small subunit [Eubacteriales bacterium OttesenSCG-928-A19]|nr:P27 family phage terminase small subunit [Eubacteriales bacterium OttesenSCG-928-A19]